MLTLDADAVCAVVHSYAQCLCRPQVQRMLSNEDAIVPVLSNAVMTWNSKSCLRNPGDGGCRKVPVYFEFATMELGDHRWYPEQVGRGAG